MYKTDVLAKINDISAKPRINGDDIKVLAGYLDELKTADADVAEYAEVLPALTAYKCEHTAANLKKLCVEVSELCMCIYASTRSTEERTIYGDTIRKIYAEL